MAECGPCLLDPCRCSAPADVDCTWTDQIVCPWCGHKHEHGPDWGDGGEHNCAKCERLFDLEIDWTPDFSTQRMERCKCDRRNKLVDRDICYLCSNDKWRAEREAKARGSAP
jgi:hypothetical protein